MARISGKARQSRLRPHVGQYRAVVSIGVQGGVVYAYSAAAFDGCSFAECHADSYVRLHSHTTPQAPTL